MTDTFEWDGTEACLENLFIWWGRQIPWEHSSDCDGIPLHCCEGIYEFESTASLRGLGRGIRLFFSDGVMEQPVDIGDRIHYLGEGRFMLEKQGKYSL